MANESLLRVLTVFDSTEKAELLLNTLRNAGHIVRSLSAEDEEELQSTLEEQPVDLILLHTKAPGLGPDRALEVLSRSGRDIPAVLVSEGDPEPALVALLGKGARDTVAIDQGGRLTHVVQREMADLNVRRAHRHGEQMLRETEKRARALIDSSRDAIAYVHDGMHIYANSAYLKMFGYDDADDIQGVPIMDMVDGDDHAKFKEFLRSYAKGDIRGDTSLEVQGLRADGRSFKITMEFTPASMEGEACTQIIIRDQSISKELEKKLNVLSKQDLLTGLYNRSYFMEQVDKLVSRAVDGGTRGALFHIQLDGFKAIKENVGISGSDLFLADIAKLLKERIKEDGVLARFEGEVFTLLIEGMDPAQAESLAGELCALVADHISDIGGQSVHATASIGISPVNETAGSSQKVLINAEKACDMAHKAGGNKVHLHNPAVEEMAEREQVAHWTQQIRAALKENRFRLLYQPIVSLHGESGEHYEVLVRMLDKDNNEIPPDEFLPAAERGGLMHYVDRWVIASAFKALTERSKQGRETRLFVKLSSASLTDANFLPWVSERIKAMRLNAENLVFELSEPAALNHLAQAKAIIQGLKSLHCRFALGHFGNEPSTFGSLKHLDVDYIKVASELVNGLAGNPDNQERVREIAEEARRRGKKSIAAFVEDANSLAVLWQSNVDFIQGYFLQAPESSMSYDFSGQG